MKNLTLTIPKGNVPRSYYWPKKTISDFWFSTYFCVTMGIWMWIQQHTSTVGLFYLGALSFQGLALLWAKWRARSKGWKHFIEERGIWAEPSDTWRWPKKQSVLRFEKVDIQGIEDRFYRGEHSLRIHFSRKAFRGYEMLDLPYLSKDKDLVQIELIPFLNSKIAETATDSPDATAVKPRSRVTEAGWNWDGYSRVTIDLPTPPESAPLRYLWLSSEMGSFTTCLLFTPIAIAIWISDSHGWIGPVILIVMLLMAWATLSALLKIKRASWLQHIEDKGLWVESITTQFSKPHGKVVLEFSKHTLLGVEQISMDGNNFVRIHYRFWIFPESRTLDMPYLTEDTVIVETELIPYLRSKITQTAVQGTA